MDRKDIAIAVLTALGIQELEYTLDGGGDSGEANLDRIQHVDGRTLEKLPNLAIGIDGAGRPYTLVGLLDDLVYDLPERDWINNEGGYGKVVIRPCGEDEELRFDCNMTYRDEGDYGDDDEEFVDESEEYDTAFEDWGVSP